MELCGKKVIVTGGARGLGRSMVEQLALYDAVIAVFDVDARGLHELSIQTPKVHCVRCDVSDYEQVVAATTRYHSQFGAADVLVNNAGILYSAPLVHFNSTGLLKHDVEMWRKVMAVNLDSVFYMTACIVARMIASRVHGVIVNVSSISAVGNAGQSAYSAAKAGVNALTATWAKELGMMGIRAVAIAPGFTETDSTKLALSEAVLRETTNRVPLRRLGSPKEIADAVVHVIKNDYFNGKVFELDGGLTL